MKNLKTKTVIETMFRGVLITTTIVEASSLLAGLINGLIIAKALGETSMAAQGIVQPLYTITYTISGLLAVGMQLCCSFDLSRGKIEDAKKTFNVALVVGFICSVILSLALFIWAEPVAVLLGARDSAAELLEESSLYIKSLSFAMIPSFLSVIIGSVLGMDSDSMLMRKAAPIMIITNVVFDIVFIRRGLGLEGIGLATSIGSLVYTLILMIHFFKKDKVFTFSLKDLHWRSIKDIIICGSSKAVTNATYSLGLILLNTIMVQVGGTVGMSALSVRNNVTGLLFIPTTGIAGAVAVMTSMAYGEKNKQECIQIGKLAHKYLLGYCLASTVILIAFSGVIARFYAETEELFVLIRFTLMVVGLYVFLDGLVSSRFNYLQSVRGRKESQMLTILTYVVISTIAAIICGKIWGVYGVLVSSVFASLITLICVYAYRAAKGKKIILGIDDYMNLSEDFNLKPYDVIELTISNQKEAATVAEQVQLFCKGHKIDPEKGYKAALCLEEITTNIVEHGYLKTKKQISVDVRVTIDEDDVIMKIRDNCQKFDLTEQIRSMESQKGSEKNIGIRMIQKTAKEIKYIHLIGTNTLLIKV